MINGRKKADTARQELRQRIFSLEPLIDDMTFFRSEEFSLIICYLASLFWLLPLYGIELEGSGAKAVKNYMVRVFERESFQQSLTEVEREISK